ncbi:MAG: hypothetical protein H0X61_02955 [Acidimicrobiia bacterium]|jgi:hypothetical protein|nr:hypothetical protein [Acidimicrobiia bacterium]
MTDLLDDAWGALLTTALLGTDRRQPPAAPPGPIADVVADLAVIVGDSAPDAVFLNQLAVMTVARRVALQPGRPAHLLAPPADDPRPLCAPAAARQWRSIVDGWPVLEDEWMATVWQRGERVPADVLVDMLELHRTDVRRRQLAQQIGGPVVRWMSEHLDVPLAPPPRPGVDPAALSELPLHPDVAPLVNGDPNELASRIGQVLAGAGFAAADRRLVEHVVARMPSASLPAVVPMLDSMAADQRIGAAAAIIADLARRRLAMLASFEEDR